MEKRSPNVVQRANGVSWDRSQLPTLPLTSLSAKNNYHANSNHELFVYPIESSASVGGLYPVAFGLSHLDHHNDQQTRLLVIVGHGS